MNRIIFILDQISQPRCLKRIESIKKHGIPFEAWGFDKNLYNSNITNQSFDINIFKYNPLISNKLKKFYLRWRIVRNLVNRSNKNIIFYFFGFDIALFALAFNKNIKYIYEESDITYARRNVIIFNILKYIDNNIRRKSLITIFTSEGFSNYFYENKTIPSNLIIQPNKLHPSILNYKRNYSLITSNKSLRFGFIGLIRYKTIFNFAKTIGEYYSNHEFHFWGDSREKSLINQLENTYPNIFYHGSFKNPSDLQSIYSKIDIVVSCYDVTNLNTRFAEPNKIYEAMYFCKPIIVSKDTYIEQKVQKLEIGYSVDASNASSIKELIDNLSVNDLNIIINNTLKIAHYELIDESDNICTKIQRFS